MSERNLDIYKGRSRTPTRDVSSLHRGIDRLFDDFLNLSPPQWDVGMPQVDFSPSVDVEEQEDHYLVSMDLPGVKKEDVRIEINDSQLVVSGERRDERVEEKKNRYFVERSYGTFQRIFTLPSNVDPSKIEADFQDGVLRIALPKAQEAKARTVEIGGQKGGGLLTRIFSGKKEEQKQEQPKKAAS